MTTEELQKSLREKNILLLNCRNILNSAEIKSFFKDNDGTMQEIEDLIFEIDHEIGLTERRQTLENNKNILLDQLEQIDKNIEEITEDFLQELEKENL